MSENRYDLDFLPAVRPVDRRPGAVLPLLLLAIGVLFLAVERHESREAANRWEEARRRVEARAAEAGAGSGSEGWRARERVEERVERVPWKALLALLAEELPPEGRIERIAYDGAARALRIEGKGSEGTGAALAGALARDPLVARSFPTVREEKTGPSSFVLLAEERRAP
ncbi:MAG: hypothetical protein FJY73_03605 [Candidatus Eisenbacteria bacterium]|nr:hypothetical protein [Candidatus Eisenbacteria bacterium]